MAHNELLRCPHCVNGVVATESGQVGVCVACNGTGWSRTWWHRRDSERSDSTTAGEHTVTDEQLGDAAEIVSALRRIPAERRFDALVIALKIFVEHPERIDEAR